MKKKFMDGLNKQEQYLRHLKLWKEVLKLGIKEQDEYYIYSELFRIHCNICNLNYRKLREIYENTI